MAIIESIHVSHGLARLGLARFPFSCKIEPFKNERSKWLSTEAERSKPV